MQTGTIVMMVLVLGWVWGGFAYLIWRSMVAEQTRAGRVGAAGGTTAPDGADRGSEG